MSPKDREAAIKAREEFLSYVRCQYRWHLGPGLTFKDITERNYDAVRLCLIDVQRAQDLVKDYRTAPWEEKAGSDSSTESNCAELGSTMSEKQD